MGLFPFFLQGQSFKDSLAKGEQLLLHEDYLSAFTLFLPLASQLESDKTDPNTLAYVYMHLGNCYEYFDYDKNAILYLEKAIALFKQTQNNMGLGYCLAYYGDILEDLGQTGKAMTGYAEALHCFEKLHHPKGIALVYDNMASTFETLEEYDSASFYLNKAYFLFSGLHDTLGLIKVMNNQGDVSRRQGEPMQSLALYRKALALSQGIHNLEEERGNLKDLSRTYAKLGQYQEAYTSFEKFFTTHTRLKIEDKIERITKLQLANLEARNKLEIQSLEKEKELMSLRLTLIILSLGLTIAFLVALYIAYRTKTRKDKQLSRIKQDLLEAELKNNQLERENLRQELEMKVKKLSNYTKKLLLRNELVDQLKGKLDEALEKEKIQKSSRLKMLEELSHASILTDEDWKRFKRKFEDVHTGFFTKLKERYPELTTGDLRLAAIMKLKLSQSEIASMMGISEDSVKKAKQRLRNKLSAQPDFKLKEWVETLN